MPHFGTWRTFEGSSSILLAIAMLIITGVLIALALRLRKPIAIRRSSRLVGITIVVLWWLFAFSFVVAASIYGHALLQQVGPITLPADPIFPVTFLSGGVSFFVIVYLAQQHGFWGAYGSAVVGAIAGVMIFELPFDLIVMWRTYPPAPAIPYTLLKGAKSPGFQAGDESAVAAATLVLFPCPFVRCVLA